MAERRSPGLERDRIAVIAKHFAEVARTLDRKYSRVARTLNIALVIGLVSLAAGGWQLHRQAQRSTEAVRAAKQVAAEQTVARYRAVFSACLERNRTNNGIIRYLRKLGSPPREIKRARHFFPNEPSCPTYAIALLGSPAPAGAFDLPESVKPPP